MTTSAHTGSSCQWFERHRSLVSVLAVRRRGSWGVHLPVSNTDPSDLFIDRRLDTTGRNRGRARRAVGECDCSAGPGQPRRSAVLALSARGRAQGAGATAGCDLANLVLRGCQSLACSLGQRTLVRRLPARRGYHSTCPCETIHAVSCLRAPSIPIYTHPIAHAGHDLSPMFYPKRSVASQTNVLRPRTAGALGERARGCSVGTPHGGTISVTATAAHGVIAISAP